MTALFVTRLSSLERPLFLGRERREMPVGTFAIADRAGFADGVPFILNDDGSYDRSLNRFFIECRSMGLRSPNSLKAYARDILTWMRFLIEWRGKTIWSADGQDLIAYHRARRQGPASRRISAASWNRSVAALEKFYCWAAEEDLISLTPFSYRRVWHHRPGARRAVLAPVNSAYEPAARRHDMRFIDLDRFLQFRDIGLRGRLPDGTEDPDWHGRNGERNALFAELLVTTGMRISEAAYWLTHDLPSVDAKVKNGVRTMAFTLPAAITKGAKRRDIRLPVRVLRQLQDYVGLERANAAVQFTSGEALRRRNDWLYIRRRDGQRLQIARGDDAPQWVALHQLSPSERHRLLDGAGGGTPSAPAALWLTEGGTPMPVGAWAAVFRRASRRCRDFGVDLDVTPHMLRHAYAVHMLSLLIRAQIGFVLESRRDMPGAAYKRTIGDPLQKLQRLLGHASIMSTYVYLDSLEECRALVEAAASQMAMDISDAAQREASP
ncbi:MAG: tyrosine-type recombinase/integrase [Alphaproteobacteria bacterium]